jgi:nucleoside-diphosphate-sugar epimerase
MFSDNPLYAEDISAIANYDLDWKRLKNKSIMITGATGLIGTFLIDALMHRNAVYNDAVTIYAIGRNRDKALARFENYLGSNYFFFVQHDIKMPVELDAAVDFIIHGASNTHPAAYAKEPIDTILLSILGTKNVLDFAVEHNIKRTLFLSTVEIYGENRKDVERFQEDYCGYIDCNTLRAGYPEGKRAAEALCQAYINERNIDVLIARCCRVYGPTMGIDDSKAIAQFLRNAGNNQPIVLKSKGTQKYSFCYAADICSAILTVLLSGSTGEAYNISDDASDLSLSEIAAICAEYGKTDVVFDVPSSIESSGYSKATKALMDSAKLRELGWEAEYTLPEGIKRTIRILELSGNSGF